MLRREGSKKVGHVKGGSTTRRYWSWWKENRLVNFSAKELNLGFSVTSYCCCNGCTELLDGKRVRTAIYSQFDD